MDRRSLLLGGMAAFLAGCATALAAPPADAIPPFAEVKQAVWKYFEAKTEFESDDLITRDEVATLLARLQKTWLPPTDAAKILDRTVVKGEFIANQLGTPNGRKFMRSIGDYPDAYDRIDRLSRMPYGQQTIIDLIRGPGGERMIEYMTKTSGGRELGKQLSNAPDGKDFNARTGRIYTVADLLEWLQKSHTAVLKGAPSPFANVPPPAFQTSPIPAKKY